MHIRRGDGITEYGPGIQIELSGDEVARAIDAFLTANDVHIRGARTVSVNGQLCKRGEVYIDPSATMVHAGVSYSGGPGK